MSIGPVLLSKHLTLCCPPLLSSIFPRIRIFSNESSLRIRWPEYWSFNFSISLSNAYSRLISFRIDWSDLLAVQETPKGLLQHHSSKAAILQCSAFFMVQILHPYMTTGKIIVSIYEPLLAKWCLCSLICSLTGLSLLFFQGTSVLISWLQSSFAVILEPKEIKFVTVSSFSSSIYHEVMELDATILVLWMLSLKPAFSLSFFTFIKRFFSSSSLSAIRVISPVCMRLLFLLAILILACRSPSPTFHMMYSAEKLNKQGENKQPWCTFSYFEPVHFSIPFCYFLSYIQEAGKMV